MSILAGARTGQRGIATFVNVSAMTEFDEMQEIQFSALTSNESASFDTRQSLVGVPTADLLGIRSIAGHLGSTSMPRTIGPQVS
jgi:hypothetical protein